MSKEAAVRAMREARYAERTSRPPTPARAVPVAPPVTPPRPTPSPPDASTGASTDAACGHRSMNGRTCTRELGHTAKNHRYS